MCRLATRKRQWLLALLTLRADREVERDWLAGTLWPESGEARALANLRQSLTELRSALVSQVHRLHSTARTVTLHLEDAFADVVAFDALVTRGDSASLEAAISL